MLYSESSKQVAFRFKAGLIWNLEFLAPREARGEGTEL